MKYAFILSILLSVSSYCKAQQNDTAKDPVAFYNKGMLAVTPSKGYSVYSYQISLMRKHGED